MLSSPVVYCASLEYQKSNLWDFYLSDNPEVKFRIKSAPVLFETLETKSKWTGEKYYTGVQRIEDFTIEVYETVQFDTYAYFQTWMNLVYNPITGKFRTYPPGTTPPYVKTAFVNFYTVGGVVEVASKVFTLWNVKIKGFSQIDLNYETGDPLMYSITLTADIPNPFGF